MLCTLRLDRTYLLIVWTKYERLEKKHPDPVMLDPWVFYKLDTYNRLCQLQTKMQNKNFKYLHHVTDYSRLLQNFKHTKLQKSN